MRRRALLIWPLLALCLSTSVHSQQPAPLPTITRADLEAASKRIQDNTALDSNTKSRIVEIYNQALDALKSADDYDARVKTLADARLGAQDRVAELKAKLDAKADTSYQRKLRDATTDALHTELAKSEQEQAVAEAEVQRLQDEDDSRLNRRQQLTDLSTAAQEQLNQVRSTDTTAQGAGPEEAEANRAYRAARAQSLEAEIKAYAEELNGFDARRGVLSAEKDLAKKTVADAREKVQAIGQMTSLHREEQSELAIAHANEALAAAQSAQENIRPYLVKIAERNIKYAEMRAGPDSPSAGIDRARDEGNKVRADFDLISSQLTSVKPRVKAAGLSEAVGKLLRLYRTELPPRREHLTNIRVREALIGKVQLDLFDLTEERNKDINDIQADLTRKENLSAETVADLRAALTPYVDDHREILESLRNEQDEYLSELYDLNDDERKLVHLRDTFSDFIDQHVLWIASGGVISKSDFRQAGDAVRWLVDWRNWKQVVEDGLQDIRHDLLVESVALLAFSGVLFARRWQIRRIGELATLAEKRTATNYYWTIEVAVHTLLMGGYGSLLLAYVRWRLMSVPEPGSFTGLLADALWVVAAVLASVEIPRQMFRPRGLGEVHFGWDPAATAKSRMTLSWAIPIALPVLLLIAMIEKDESREWRESVGRLAFFFLMLLWSGVGHMLTNRKAPGVAIFFPLRIPGERSRMQRLLYMLAAGAPLCLAIAAAMGYYDTALRIAVNIHVTLVYSLVVSMGVGLAMRALLVTRRKLAIEQARKKRADMLAAAKKSGDTNGNAAPTVESQAPEIDLDEIDAQTTRLTRSAAIAALCVGMWFIWVNFFPALQVLDEITIGDTTASIRDRAPIIPLPILSNGSAATPAASAVPVAAATAAAAGNSTTAANTILSPNELVARVESLTYADILLAAIIVWLTVSASRNMPGLVEIAILQRTSLSPGERYAIKAVLGYVFVLIGAWLVFATLGLQWARFQWLVAGLGLGIGFGLQEIFANFISGLIILFEQPVRVGDTVTVGDVNGTVTRIRIRATTITDGELKELIVPNKEFVTGKLVNWSLSDTTLRTTIPVCVAYGTDTQRVRQLLQKVALENPRVLKDPPPSVALTRFAENGLVFETRVYVANNEQLGLCRDELHDEINDAFKEASVEMPLPQQDVHIRSVPSPVSLPTELDKA